MPRRKNDFPLGLRLTQRAACTDFIGPLAKVFFATHLPDGAQAPSRAVPGEKMSFKSSFSKVSVRCVAVFYLLMQEVY